MPTSSNHHNKKKLLLFTPLAGFIIFCMLYYYATTRYPGGSQAHAQATGFSWKHNYWCNLLNERGINGEFNTARPVAIVAMFVLSLSLALFWYTFAQQVKLTLKLKYTIQFSGIATSILSLLLLTKINHDTSTNLISFCGLIATTGVFIALFQYKWKGLIIFGSINIILVILNNYLYYNEELIIHLPVLQKISFASFLCWTSSIIIVTHRLTDANK